MLKLYCNRLEAIRRELMHLEGGFRGGVHRMWCRHELLGEELALETIRATAETGQSQEGRRHPDQ